MAPPPPSFSSFPDLAPKPPPKPKPPPPSFASFPSASTSTSDDRPSKRARATDFLDELSSELLSGTRGKESRSHGREQERRRERDGERERSEEREERRSGKSKGKERERDHRKKEKRSSREKREDAVGSLDPMGRGRELEAVRGEFGQSEKPWKLVKVPLAELRAVEPPPAPVTEARLFYVDKRGDDFNIRYGGLHKGDIPRYRRLGGGRVVGFNSGLRITKETAYSGRGLEVGPNTQYRTPRYIDPRSFLHTTDKHAKRLMLTSRRAALALGESSDSSSLSDPFLASSLDPTRFVPFEPEQSVPDKLAQLEFEEGTDYRSIAGLVRPADLEPAEESEEDDLFGGAGITGGESQDDYLKRRNLELDRALRESPKNVDLWLEFVDFQDEVALTSFMGGSAKRALSKVERTSTSEIKLSILDRALAVAGNQDSESLLLAYLRAASDVWDPEKVLHRWGETLRSHPKLTGLWIEYVSWRQTSWANFGVREVVEVFEESFKVLVAAGEKEKAGSNGREMLEGNSIYLFLRLCLMLRQACFSERALAAFQALIELNFFRPDKHLSPTAQEPESKWRARTLTDLETFWDSEVPRIGETGAKGWKNSSDDAEPPPSTDSSLFSTLSDFSDPFERWLASEHLTATSQPRPARATDPGVDDDIDPFRVVLFDDVRDFLFVVHSPDSKIQLIYAFLTFLGLPFVPPDYPTSNPFSTDTFIHSELAERPLLRERFWPKMEVASVPFDTVSGEAMEPERRSALAAPFEVPFHATPVTVDLLFGTKQGWFLTLVKEDLKHIDVDFVRNVFTILRPVAPADGFLTLDFFSFEACQSPKAAVKLAKQVLRDNRQNLALWDGYARIERQRGKVDEARAVYVTALSMYREFNVLDQIDGPLLWRAWAEMEWEEGRSMLALKVLVASAAPVVEEVDLAALAKVDPNVRPSLSQILRARQYYTTQLEASFQQNATQSTLRNRNHVAYSAALFEYISQDLAPAVDILERHLFRLDCDGAFGSSEHEEAFMLYAKLLYRHASAGVGYKPGQLRDVLERAITAFPNNSLFLSVFYYNELRMKVQNRVRRTLESSVLTEKLATSEGWLFAIFAELHLDARSHSVWGVRNLFDRAIENPRTRPSASLWTLFIDFEIRNGELARAKALVYRAVRECPWCKELYLKPFAAPLRSMYRSNELRELHRLLLEKGLRVRLELDDFAEGWRSEPEDMEQDSSDDERGGVVKVAEELYQERARLMPY